jgi:hypothetical protein
VALPLKLGNVSRSLRRRAKHFQGAATMTGAWKRGMEIPQGSLFQGSELQCVVHNLTV